ncbi:MAG: magnesium transporter [Verrucomicrobiota bacterium JB022]|nr:magnesium transporter [Verrucomicrobiota bacterium JB022]
MSEGEVIMTPNEVSPYTMEELMAWPSDDLGRLDHLRLAETSAHTIASVLDRLEVDERRVVLRQLNNERAAHVLSEMDEENAAEVLSAMRELRAVKVLDSFDADDAADVVAELEDEDRERLLAKIESGWRETIERLLEYDPDTAGGLMTTEVATVFDVMSIDATIERIRGYAEQFEDLHYVYVVDRKRHLMGIVSLRRIIQARPTQKVRDIMKTDIRGIVKPETDQEDVARLMAEYNLPDIAVVDDENHLLGVITHDDILDVVYEEATEDIQKLAGAGGDESLTDKVAYSVKRRIPWLHVNLATAFMASAVVMAFNDQISAMPVLAAFMPIVAGIGGNSGQQALAVAIRSMAIGEIHDAEKRVILFKQLSIGLINGLAVGCVAAVIAYFITGEPMLSLVILMAMIANMAIAGVSGAFIPLALRALKRDPAQSSSIFLTALTDTGGFLIFLALGSWLLL